jgi:hypothetical protein
LVDGSVELECPLINCVLVVYFHHLGWWLWLVDGIVGWGNWCDEGDSGYAQVGSCVQGEHQMTVCSTATG